MLTGRYPHSTGAGELHQPLPKNQALLTTPLRRAGYYTASAGKWHLGPQAKTQFDEVKEGGGAGGEGHWVDVLQKRPKDQPFFFWFAAVDPHRDYQPGAIAEPHRVEDVRVPPIFPDTPEVRRDLALYYDEISRFDEGIGAVLTELEAQGILENTFLLVITDNGRPFPRCKTRVNVDGIKTPFIVHFPKLVRPGQTTDSLVSTLDIAPTILDLAQIERPASFQGVSFATVLTDSAASVRDFAFAEHNWHDYRAFERAVIGDEWLLIRNWLPELPGTPPADAVRSPTYREMIRLNDEGELAPDLAAIFAMPRPSIELYAWTRDLHCLNNLSNDPGYEDHQQRLLKELARWQEETGDRFPGAEALTPDTFDRQTGLKLQ